MSSNGFVGLPNHFFNETFWQERRPFSKAEAWIDIVKEARWSYKPTVVPIGLRKISCERGQCIKSLETWASRWKWSKSRVRRFLAVLRNRRDIDTENVAKTTRITVCNYDDYNYRRRDNGAKTDAKTTPKEQRTQREQGNKPPVVPPVGRSSEESGDQLKTLPRPKPKQPPSARAMAMSEHLMKLVTNKKNVRITPAQVISWARIMDKMVDGMGVDLDRQQSVMVELSRHYGEEMWPVVESGKSWKEKFTRIEDAIRREKPAKKAAPSAEELYILGGPRSLE